MNGTGKRWQRGCDASVTVGENIRNRDLRRPDPRSVILIFH